jgi:chromosome partitioning protein
MKVVSVINYKGGVGKTTLTANLASEMVNRGKKVLVIDLDPQTNLTFSYMSVPEWSKKYENSKTIKYWFDAILDDSIPVPSFKDLTVTKNGLDIICSHLGLINVDIELAAGLAAGTDRQHKRNYLKTYSYIIKELQTISSDYDIVLFDCPPNFSIVTKNALVASDYYIVPAKMDYLSTLGINQLRNNVNGLVKQYNEYGNASSEQINPQMLGVIATMISVRNNAPISAQQNYISQLQRNNIPLFKQMIRENKTIYADAPANAEPVVLKKGSYGTYAFVVKELEDLTTEFTQKAGI